MLHKKIISNEKQWVAFSASKVDLKLWSRTLICSACCRCKNEQIHAEYLNINLQAKHKNRLAKKVGGYLSSELLKIDCCSFIRSPTTSKNSKLSMESIFRNSLIVSLSNGKWSSVLCISTKQFNKNQNETRAFSITLKAINPSLWAHRLHNLSLHGGVFIQSWQINEVI